MKYTNFNCAGLADFRWYLEEYFLFNGYVFILTCTRGKKKTTHPFSIYDRDSKLPLTMNVFK